MALTPKQQEAIESPPGHIQLIACAGSGKTEVVAQRIAYLLGQDSLSLSPGNIVAFTFTEKAAAELKDRIVKRCRERLGDIPGLAELYVGTIHAFCLDLLKSEVPRYLKYAVLNDVQQALIIDRYSRVSGLTASTDLQGKPLRRFTDTSHFRGALAILREAALVDAELKGCSVVAGLRMYRDLIEKHAYFDYTSIMTAAVDALLSDQEMRSRLADRVRHVIVDEYQDVNPIQECIVRVLADLGAHICVVGDDDQTVYQWRGSDVENILTFASRFPDARQIPMEENFRSSKGIVETARRFIARNDPDRLAKEMKSTDAQPYEAGDIVALEFADPDQEAYYIAKSLKELHGVAIREGEDERGLAWSDMAILLRSVKNSAGPLLQALDRHGVRYVVVGMNELFGTPEARAARELFYFLARRDGVTRQTLTDAWNRAGLGLDLGALATAIEGASAARESMGQNEQERWSVYNLQRQFLKFLEDAGLREEAVPDERGEIVFYNLGKFSQVISDFEAIHFHSDPVRKYGDFAGFLEHQAEGAYPEGWQDNAYANPDAVRIMTIHQAKGMQWPVVCIPQLTRNRFPMRRHGGRTVWHLIPRSGVIGSDRYATSLQDERRLFYVAMTRSQKFLFLTWAPIPGTRDYRSRSEFFENILESKWVKPLAFDYSARRRLPARQKAGVANVVLSFSDLKYFFECPYQFKLRILYGFNAPIHEALGYGKSLHDALAEIHARAISNDYIQEDEVPRLVETHLHTPYAYNALRETLERSAEKVLRAYLTKNGPHLDKIVHTEKTIEVNLDGGITVVGRIDLVKRLDTNETSIVDFKSNDRTQAESVTQAQLHLYALGYRELTGSDADYVEVYDLEEGSPARRAVHEELLSGVKASVTSAAEALRANRLDKSPAATRCGSCDYKRLCSEGSRTERAGAARAGTRT